MLRKGTSSGCLLQKSWLAGRSLGAEEMMSSLKTLPFRSAQGSKIPSPFGSGYSDSTDLGTAMYDLMVWQSVM